MRKLTFESGRNSRRDDGAVLIIVAMFSLVAVLFMAFVIDIGNQRQNRRQLTTATDSPVLAVAQEWVGAGADPAFDCDSTTIDEQLSAANNPVGNATPTYTCDFTQVNPFRGGVVTIAATEAVDQAFGGVTGVDSLSTGSLTSVRVQTVVGGGLRPVAFCSGDFSRAGWTTPSPGIEVAPATATATVTFTNTSGRDADPCRTNGNWNQVLFRASNTCPGESNASSGSQTFRDQYENGSPYDVAINECVSRLPGTGGFNSGDPEILEGMVVTFPVFDETAGGGAGIYLVAGFLEAEVVDVDSHGNTTSFELRPLRYITSGPCCLVNEFNVELQVCDTGTIGGAPNPDGSANCQPRNAGGGATPPVIPDMCQVVGYDPWNPTVEVNASNESTAVRAVAVDVADFNDCGAMAMNAVHNSQTVSAPAPTRSGNRYSFSYPAGTPFDSPGTTYMLELLEDGLLLDDSATLETVGVSTPTVCQVTALVVSPDPVRTSGNSGNLSSGSSPVTVTATVNDATSCAGLAIRLTREASGSTSARVMVGSAGSTAFSAEYTNAGNSQPRTGGEWLDGTYLAEALLNGVRVGEATRFAISS